MRRRTRARQFALQILYQIDITRADFQEALDNFWQAQEEPAQDELRQFTDALVTGVIENFKVIDAKISEVATNWQIKRMAVVDRNILRLGCYELMFRKDIPLRVTINEAVELAKKYSVPEAGKFINGILDKINKENG